MTTLTSKTICFVSSPPLSSSSSSSTSLATCARLSQREAFSKDYNTCLSLHTLSLGRTSTSNEVSGAYWQSNAAIGWRHSKKQKKARREHTVVAVIASSLPAVTERTISLPVDYYQVLGAETHFLADAIITAYESRVNNLPAEGFSKDAVIARQEILKGACETLADPELRGEYNQSLVEDEAGTIMVDVPFSKVPGALCLLQEASEMDIVLEVGQNLLRERLTKSYRRDVILAMALAYVELSREAMADSTPAIIRSCELLERALKLLQQEGGSSLAPRLQQQIDETIQHLNPRCLLELLSLPLGKEHEGKREEGKQGVRTILWTFGEGGSFAPVPGFTREEYMREAFARLTAAEQVAFFIATPSNIPAESSEVFAVALAHVAEGFVAKKPHLIREADTLFLELQQVNASPDDAVGDFRPVDQRLEFAFERGMCALLLGEIDDCRAWLGLDDAKSPYRDPTTVEFLIANASASEGDFLPGLCKLLENWLGEVIFPSFREMKGMRVTLRDYFDDPSVMNYLEKLEKGGSPLAAAAAIVQLGAGVKASALETLQKVFPLGKSNGGPRVNDNFGTMTKAQPDFSSNQGLSMNMHGSSHVEADIHESSHGGPRPPGAVWGDNSEWPEVSKKGSAGCTSPLKIAGATVLIGAMAFGGWRMFLAGKGHMKEYVKLATMANSLDSAVSSGVKKALPQMDALTAEGIIRRWQAVKSQALGRGHAFGRLSEVLDGKTLQSWSERAKDVQRNGWYWDYKLTGLNVDNVTISTDGKRAIIEATLWEGASLYDEKKGTVSDSYQSSYTTRYELSVYNGGWKITSGTVLRS